MAASNDSQGLKIAVAVFIALAVILAVTSYFLYSNWQVAEARLTKANEDIGTLRKGQSDQQNTIEDLRTRLGVRTTEADAIKSEIDAQNKKLNERLEELSTAVNAAMQKVQQAGGQPQEMQDLTQTITTAIQSFRADNVRSNYIASLDRLSELMKNLAMLTTEMGVNYLELRHSLESATSVTKQEVAVQTKAAEASRADLQEEAQKHVSERQMLLTKVDSLTKENDLRTTEIANLKAQLDRQKEDYDRERSQYRTQISELRDKAERTDTILDHPDGYITFVDYNAMQVHTNINRAMGAQPQMVLSVFDARSPGIPTEKPKGTIELTKVGDRISVARIIKTINPIEPIREGDIVYSPAWSPNNPTRYALVGKIDINRDGRDDREELKRMIQDSGGVVEFDLPPPWIGKETGQLSPRIDWYVTDDRIPLRDVYRPRSEPIVADEAKLAARVGQVTKEARADGIRPMPIERLLSYLGYDINTPVVGRAEAVNQRAIQRLLAPKSGQEGAAAARAKANAAAAPGAEPAAEPKPKEDAAAGNEEPAADDTPKKKATPRKKAAEADDQ